MKSLLLLLLLAAPLIGLGQAKKTTDKPAAGSRVRVTGGVLEGSAEAGLRVFRGVPFAAPPVGALRWQPPQPVQPWAGVRTATAFAARPMQLPLFGDMNFRSPQGSEDCLYLNVWTPAAAAKERLPVLVYFYGGGFVAGDASEPRYDGAALARRGLVTVTVNYRLGVFGFLAHPELTKESGRGASGNYGLLDQQAALRWVQQNIAQFGGDPQRVTIGGESAGSMSVSGQMASPGSKGLFQRAIGESGSLLGSSRGLPALAAAEQTGASFAASLQAPTLAALRALPAEELLAASGKPEAPRFGPIVDGYFLPQPAAAIFAAGQQARVPLLVGWNSEEMNAGWLLGTLPPTPENYQQAVQKRFGDRAADVLKLYPAATPTEAAQSATDLAGDLFIGYSSWKWATAHQQTGQQPVYRYLYAHPRPAMVPALGNATPGLAGGVLPADPSKPKPPAPRGAVHSAEIEYALGNLATNQVYAWTATDYQVSDLIQRYFANFIKTGNPTGAGLAPWPAAGGPRPQQLRIGASTRAEPSTQETRYQLLDELLGKP